MLQETRFWEILESNEERSLLPGVVGSVKMVCENGLRWRQDMRDWIGDDACIYCED